MVHSCSLPSVFYQFPFPSNVPTFYARLLNRPKHHLPLRHVGDDGFASILGLEAPGGLGGSKHPGCPKAARTYLKQHVLCAGVKQVLGQKGSTVKIREMAVLTKTCI